MKKVKAAVLSTVVGAMSPLAMIAPASAITNTWTGFDESSNNWNNSDNWSSGFGPGNGDTLIFPTSARYQVTENDIAGTLELVSIIFNGEFDPVNNSSKDFSIEGGSIEISDSIQAKMTGNGGNHTIDSDVVLGDDVTFSTSGVDTLTVGGDETTLDLAGNALTLSASGGTITIQGVIDGEGSVEVAKGRVNMLAEPGDDYDATTTVSGGEYIVSATSQGSVTIDGGVLKGESGDTGLLGTVTLNDGSIEPGMSPGCLNVSELVLNGGTYEVELEGNAQCTEYDSTAVAGDVDLGEGDVTLDIQRLSSFEPEVDDVFAIITYSDDSDVSGYFEGLEDGESVTLAEYTYEINYDDDDAVTLTVLGTPEAPYTGVGSLLNSPLLTLSAAGAVLVVLGATRYAQVKKTQK